jgi:SAM-dependent methyltransferase
LAVYPIIPSISRHAAPVDLSSRAQPADLPELMDQPCTRADLRACLRDIAWLNRTLFGYRPILKWIESLNLGQFPHIIRILDVGCGYGDTLGCIERWAEAKGIAVQLTGLDLNPDATAIASEASPVTSRIRWVNGNVFTYKPPQPPHLIVSSLFTHHLSDNDVVRFVQWMENTAVTGWFINDLTRNVIPYRLLYLFSRIMRLHPFVRHDGPVSIARSFVRDDWEHYCAAAGLSTNRVAIQAFTPGRLCVSRKKHS